MPRWLFAILLAVGFVSGGSSFDLVRSASANNCPTGDVGGVLYDLGSGIGEATVENGGGSCLCDDMIEFGLSFNDESDWDLDPTPVSCDDGGAIFEWKNITHNDGDLESTVTCHDTENCSNVNAVLSLIGGDNDEVWSIGLWIP